MNVPYWKNPIARGLKRAMDIVGALLGLILLGPVMMVVAILIRWRLGKPVLFRQVRAGLCGKPFVIYKFRTMTDARDAEGNLLPDEARLTPLGQFLRRYSLDELPEFFNVLKGDMSLVGPRPLYLHYVPRYSPEQKKRLWMKPGITGWAQVNGRNALSWEKRFALDVWYVENWSLWLDIKILLLTIIKVLQAEGVAHPGWATMPEFNPSSETPFGKDPQGTQKTDQTDSPCGG